MNKFLLIAQTQSEVNKKMIGAEDWIAEALKPERNINYQLAILDEAVEFMRSAIAFKWWAKNELDADNAVVELVDILHFLTSLGIVNTGSVEKCAEEMEAALVEVDKLEGEPIESDIIPALLGFISVLSTNGIEVPRYADEERADTESVWYHFWMLCRCAGVNIETVISMYRSKAVLNKFRTAMGYKLGTYRKTWLDGKEDNWYLTNYLKSVMGGNGNVYPGDEVLENFLYSNYR